MRRFGGGSAQSGGNDARTGRVRLRRLAALGYPRLRRSAERLVNDGDQLVLARSAASGITDIYGYYPGGDHPLAVQFKSGKKLVYVTDPQRRPLTQAVAGTLNNALESPARQCHGRAECLLQWKPGCYQRCEVAEEDTQFAPRCGPTTCAHRCGVYLDRAEPQRAQHGRDLCGGLGPESATMQASVARNRHIRER